MIINSKLQLGQETQALIHDTICQYESVLSSNFEKQEQRLIQQLLQDVQEKKKQLANFKKMLSQENIDRLISERRREKEKERQSLESRWRECNEAYKSLQQEQKRLISQHKENRFDAQRLQEKIAEFQDVYQKMQEKIKNMQNQRQVKFMTETHHAYRSPYKKEKSIDPNETVSSVKMQKLHESQTAFFSHKYSLRKEHFPTETKSSQGHALLSRTWKHSKPKIKTFNANYPKANPQTNQKQNNRAELFRFLLNPKVKERLFDIINRQI